MKAPAPGITRWLALVPLLVGLLGMSAVCRVEAATPIQQNNPTASNVNQTTKSGLVSICKVSDPTVVTHTLSSGGMVVGISTNGGGYINKLYVPGIGNMMGKSNAKYGRGGQSDIRDQRHGVRYNPTAAGFTDPGGTVCTAITSPGNIFLPRRACCLWFGDYRYDFIYWNNLAYDCYPDTNSAGKFIKIDKDRIPDSIEAGYANKQAQEITSEWDIYQEYNDRQYMTGNTYAGTNRVMLPAIRHYFEYDYVRDPSVPGSPLLQFPNLTNVTVSSISVTNPAGNHPCGAYDMGVLVEEFTWRFTFSLWKPACFFFVRQTEDENSLTATPYNTQTNYIIHETYRNVNLMKRVTGFGGWNAHPKGYSPLVIYADGSDPTKANAVGLYFPQTHINTTVAGVDRDGTTVYTDNRVIQTRFLLEFHPNGIMTGFQPILTGILNPKSPGVPAFERVRGEVYFLAGTPHDIYVNAQRIHPF